MHPHRFTLAAVAAIGLALAAPAGAQEAAAPDAEAPAVDPAAAEPPVTAPAADAGAPAPVDPAAAEPPVTAPATGTAPAAPAQPQVSVTRHGSWEVGCLPDAAGCEMQQVAADPAGNPVVLTRLLKLPAGSPAPALIIFNSPLGTLLTAGLGYRVDSGEQATLPFEWCVQEGCVVRLGLREEDVAAMKRGASVTLRVTSIADPQKPLDLKVSLTGFTAAYDSMIVPPAPPQAPAPAPAQPEAQPQD